VSGATARTSVPWSGGPLVFVDDLESPRLSPDDHHHLSRVRRLRNGDPLVLADGRGSWRAALFADESPDGLGAAVVVPEPHPKVGVGFALVKGQKPELVVQKLTELGVDRIVPLVAERSVVRWDDTKADSARQRWERVAREAAMQSRRAWLPTVEPLRRFAEVVLEAGACRADDQGAQISLDSPLVLIGPEGGWSDGERNVDIPVVSLSDGVLRAETAAIVAGALLTALRAGLVDRA